MARAAAVFGLGLAALLAACGPLPRRLVEAGYADRIMFGSDQMV